MSFNPAPLLPGGSNGLATDAGSLNQLRSAAARDPKGSIQQTARQFEALFMQEVMKSMRSATMTSGMLDNSGTQLGTDMLDQQFAAKMTGIPGGLSEAIARQLERASGVTGTNGKATTQSAQLPTLTKKNVPEHVQDFIQTHDAAARAAASESGIPASFMLAQAAHESGWGKRVITNADGSNTHNLFGIKATPGWTGKTAEVSTTEYINGKAQRVKQTFRAYASDAEAFKDYARMISSNERYASAMTQARKGNAASFAADLQKAGYATDPEYASKLAQVINTTVRVQRAMA